MTVTFNYFVVRSITRPANLITLVSKKAETCLKWPLAGLTVAAVMLVFFCGGK